MSQQKLTINANADVAGIRPEDVQGDGLNYRINTDKKIPIVTMCERNPKNGGGSFVQYTMNVEENGGKQRQVRFLFERHLAPLAKAWGEDPDAWTGRLVNVKGFQVTRGGGTYWDVLLTPVQPVPTTTTTHQSADGSVGFSTGAV